MSSDHDYNRYNMTDYISELELQCACKKESRGREEMGNAKSSSETPRPKYDDDDDESIRRSLPRQAKNVVDAIAGGVVAGLLALGALSLASSLGSPKLEAHVVAGVAGALVGGVVGDLLALGVLSLASSLGSLKLKAHDEDDDDDDDESIRQWLHQQTKKEIDEDKGESSTQFSSILMKGFSLCSLESKDDDESIRQWLHQQTKKEIDEDKGKSSTQFSSVLKEFSLCSPESKVHVKRNEYCYERQIKIMSYNVWFSGVEVEKRMEVIGNLVKKHSPDIIFFQEVTPDIYKLFESSTWWQLYNPSVSSADGRKSFCMMLSKLRVKMKKFISKPLPKSKQKELCVGVIDVGSGKTLIVATSHLKRRTLDMTNSEERVSQAKEALRLLQKFPNVIFGGDMNWNEDVDGDFPLRGGGGWMDAWPKLMSGEPGWTFDTESNKMLKGRKPLQKRLDRFICKLQDFRMMNIKMIGKEAIPGLLYLNEKGMELPVFPSDHYGLILTISSNNV